MNFGIIEPYENGFLEIIPDGFESDYWLIMAIHINGEVFCLDPRLYRSEKIALNKAARIYDWLQNHEHVFSDWLCYCDEFKMTLWRQPKDEDG
ncbi:MAG: hypothetical protein QNJ47_22965 [Nostocaceae cyanobacterium]|nr:hypothetical protein [Nostocaceae cyanobacterium]